MPKAHYFPSRTTGDKAFVARASADKSGQRLAAAWLISIAIIASWMLALLFFRWDYHSQILDTFRHRPPPRTRATAF
jgi:hypothetical protein